MSALDPSAPSQPTQNQAYTTSGNPASTNPSEDRQASRTSQLNQDSQTVDQRIPQKQGDYDDATASSLGRGVRGAGAGEEKYGRSEEDVGRHNELDAEQMAAPGEGRIYDAVENPGAGSGRSGAQEGLESDLDRKKAEQAPLRQEMKEQRKEDIDVGGILGQRGGPANPVDKGNYPNA